MLAKPGEVPESDSEEWAYEVKWDGIRALGYARRGRWSMLSRRQEDVGVRYPELETIAEAIGDHSAILDGEVVALDGEGRPRFQLIQSRMGLSSPGVGIHGTPNPASIGYSVSHGCIRMYIPDAEWLFNAVDIGTTVFIVSA